MITIKDAEKKLEEAKEMQKKYYSVIVNENLHGHHVRVRTKKEAITIDKCKQIIKAFENCFKDTKVYKIEIMMDVWDYDSLTAADYLNVLYGDCGVERIRNKKAIYDVKQNKLTIWEDGLPVYENYNGTICRDEAALADCLC